MKGPIASVPAVYYFLLLLLTITVIQPLCNAEDNSINEGNDDTTATDDDDELSEVEDYFAAIITSFCLLFAIFLSFTGVVIAFFAYKEDGIIRQYNEQGLAVSAIVQSVDFARAGTVQAAPKACGMCRRRCDSEEKDCDCEYVVSINYKQLLPEPTSNDCNKLLIQKQVKVTGDHFSRPLVPPTIQCHGGEGTVDISSIIHNEIGSNDSPHQMDVFVLPNYPKSAVPKLYVERALTLRYRLPTFGVVAFFWLMAALCLFMAACEFDDLMQVQWIEDHVLKAVVLSLLILITVGLVFVYSCLSNVINSALMDQYLQGGDYAIIQSDETTLSSGDDSYLLM